MYSEAYYFKEYTPWACPTALQRTSSHQSRRKWGNSRWYTHDVLKVSRTWSPRKLKKREPCLEHRYIYRQLMRFRNILNHFPRSFSYRCLYAATARPQVSMYDEGFDNSDPSTEFRAPRRKQQTHKYIVVAVVRLHGLFNVSFGRRVTFHRRWLHSNGYTRRSGQVSEKTHSAEP